MGQHIRESDLFVGGAEHIPPSLGLAPAKQAATGAGRSSNVITTTVNKVCASSLKAVVFGAQSIMLGSSHMVIAGGAESMSNTPYYLTNDLTETEDEERAFINGVLRDGLIDSFVDEHVGILAELCADEHGLSRESQDDFAINSYKRAQAATKAGLFKEIVPVEVNSGPGTTPIMVNSDDEIKKLNEEKLRTIRPAWLANSLQQSLSLSLATLRRPGVSGSHSQWTICSLFLIVAL